MDGERQCSGVNAWNQLPKAQVPGDQLMPEREGKKNKCCCFHALWYKGEGGGGAVSPQDGQGALLFRRGLGKSDKTGSEKWGWE